MAFTPVPATVLWPDSEVGPWAVTVWWRVQYGIPTPVGLELMSWRDDQPWPGDVRSALPSAAADEALPHVTGAMLRDLPMRDLLPATRSLVQARFERGSLVDEGRWLEKFETSEGFRDMAVKAHASPDVLRSHVEALDEQAAAFQGRRGTRDLGDDYYRQVAEEYARAVRAGEFPTQAVRDRWRLTDAAAAKQVKRARDRGFLPPSSGRGRVGRIEENP